MATLPMGPTRNLAGLAPDQQPASVMGMLPGGPDPAAMGGAGEMGAAMDPMGAGAMPMAPQDAGMVPMAPSGPMAANPYPTTDPGQLMAIIAQFADMDQKKAMMDAQALVARMQAEAMQPVAVVMLQKAMAQAQTVDVGGGPVGGM